ACHFFHGIKNGKFLEPIDRQQEISIRERIALHTGAVWASEVADDSALTLRGRASEPDRADF
ncbi:MAG: hypothetical protein K2X77_27245, partial [Candidatus Obscuribacterales bacterium]|nr:hypothetical protein [Candidatus Obscuribacterales bacterium]